MVRLQNSHAKMHYERPADVAQHAMHVCVSGTARPQLQGDGDTAVCSGAS